jgi:hypothetical protein
MYFYRKTEHTGWGRGADEEEEEEGSQKLLFLALHSGAD